MRIERMNVIEVGGGVIKRLFAITLALTNISTS